jgi:hypothetical protein
MDECQQAHKPAPPSPRARQWQHRRDRQVPHVGDVFSWGTLDGRRHEGIVVELDSNVAIVRLPDGREMPVEC